MSRSEEERNWEHDLLNITYYLVINSNSFVCMKSVENNEKDSKHF